MSGCPNCDTPDDCIIPVYEDKDRWDEGDQPAYLGCIECRQMMDPELLRDEDDEVPPQLPVTDHELKRIRVGNQHSSWPTIIEWQCIKGAAMYYGVSDWTSVADSTLTKGENVTLMENAATRNGGATLRMRGSDFEYYGLHRSQQEATND